MTTANRGKSAEKSVDAVLKKWNNLAAFAYHRLPDARSARGALAAQPADFYFCSKGVFGHLEVKETEHEYRLAKDKVSQLAILKKFSMAGAVSLVLVHHSTLKKWRVLYAGGLASDVPSWDLREVQTYDSAEDALVATGYF